MIWTLFIYKVKTLRYNERKQKEQERSISMKVTIVVDNIEHAGIPASGDFVLT